MCFQTNNVVRLASLLETESLARQRSPCSFANDMHQAVESFGMGHDCVHLEGLHGLIRCHFALVISKLLQHQKGGKRAHHSLNHTK